MEASRAPTSSSCRSRNALRRTRRRRWRSSGGRRILRRSGDEQTQDLANRDALLEEIARGETQLAELDQRRETLRERLKALRADLVEAPAAPISRPSLLILKDARLPATA